MITSQTHRIIDTNYDAWILKLGRAQCGWLYEVYHTNTDNLAAYGYIGAPRIDSTGAVRILEATLKLFNRTPLQIQDVKEVEDKTVPAQPLPLPFDSGPHIYKPLSLSELKLLLPHFHQECKSRRPKAGSPRTCPKCNGSGSPDIHQNNAKIASAQLTTKREDGSRTIFDVVSEKLDVKPWGEQITDAEALAGVLAEVEKTENQKTNRPALPPAEENTHDVDDQTPDKHKPKPGTPRQNIEINKIRKRLHRKFQPLSKADLDAELDTPIEAGEYLVSPSTDKRYIVTEAGYTMSNHMGDIHPQQELFAVTAVISDKTNSQQRQGAYGIEAEFARQATAEDWKLIRLVAALHFDEVI